MERGSTGMGGRRYGRPRYDWRESWRVSPLGPGPALRRSSGHTAATWSEALEIEATIEGVSAGEVASGEISPDLEERRRRLRRKAVWRRRRCRMDARRRARRRFLLAAALSAFAAVALAGGFVTFVWGHPVAASILWCAGAILTAIPVCHSS